MTRETRTVSISLISRCADNRSGGCTRQQRRTTTRIRRQQLSSPTKFFSSQGLQWSSLLMMTAIALVIISLWTNMDTSHAWILNPLLQHSNLLWRSHQQTTAQQTATNGIIRSISVWPIQRGLGTSRQLVNPAETTAISRNAIRLYATTSGVTSSSSSSTISSSALQMGRERDGIGSSALCNPEEMEYDLHVGRALDTLRADYPYILTTPPDFSIYDDGLEVVDPSGVKVYGINSYRNAFRVLHALIKLVYCPARSCIVFRMCYDTARRNIRVHWNVEAVPRDIFGGTLTTLHVDGISVYELDRQTGNITQHRIEQLLMNNIPIQPKEGVLAALHEKHSVLVPNTVFLKSVEQSGDQGTMAFGENGWTVQFQQQKYSPLLPALVLGTARAGAPSPSSLFAMEASSSDGGAGDGESFPGLDWDAYDRKNKSRKKFGLDPLTPEEFLELEAQVRQMQQQRASTAAASATAQMSQQKSEAKNNFFDKLFGGVLKDTCESNYDCTRPQICCDFGFKKMCCSSGTLVGVGDYALVPVPVENNYPPGW